MLRSLLLYLSERESPKKLLMSHAVGRRLAARFIAGEELEDALRTVRQLNAEGFAVTLDYLGESVHEAARAEDTDWPQILALYGLLKRMSDNPMVALNHAIAAAMVRGPSAGLALLDALDRDERLAGHHRLAAVRAHLLEMAGDRAAAVTHYRLAAGRTTSLPEREYLLTQAARLSEA